MSQTTYTRVFTQVSGQVTLLKGKTNFILRFTRINL